MIGSFHTLASTEKLLADFMKQISNRNDRGKPYSDSEMGIRVGKIVNKYHVAKYFVIEIKNGQFSFHRNSESIQRESELDGLYVIRTNVPLEHVVRDYKRLADVEKSFRTIKTTMLQIRPIYHRAADRVRAHFLICMLSYYVVWHLRIAWREFLFCDENIEETRANRNPVETAKPNSHLKAKKANYKKIKSTPSNNCETRIESFSSIMSELSKIVRNQCCV
ncbi:MAG: transposase, partial [Planctomycetaceae bacterium]|nr:transposase [Planctomycetaceae bacterium]